jgi:hypothetical protein
MKHKVFPSAIQEKTLVLLSELPRHITLKEVANATGLSHAWLSDFSMQKLKHPSIGRVEALYNYLTNKNIAEVL